MSKPISLFLAGREQIVERLLKQLMKMPIFHVEDTANNGQTVIKKAKEGLNVDIFLLDFALPEISGVKVAEYISLTCHKPTIIVSDQANPNFMRAAMLASAREFLVLPLNDQELEFAITRVYEIEQERQHLTKVAPNSEPKNGHLISFISGKGGVGKSITSFLTALALAEAEPQKSYLLAEINESFSTLQVLLGLKEEKSLTDLLPLAHELEKIEWQSVVSRVTTNLSFIAGQRLLENQTDNLMQILARLRHCYDLVLLDLSIQFIPAFASVTDYFVIVTTPEVAAVRLTGELIAALSQQGWGRQSLLLVLNQNNQQFLTPQQISQFLQLEIACQIPTLTLIAELANEGRLANCSRMLPEPFHHLAAKLNQELAVV